MDKDAIWLGGFIAGVYWTGVFFSFFVLLGELSEVKEGRMKYWPGWTFIWFLYWPYRVISFLWKSFVRPFVAHVRKFKWS